MEWSSKKPSPVKDGDMRTVRSFAWLPVDMDNEKMVWLETFFEIQVWRASKHNGQYPLWFHHWETIKTYQHGTGFWQSIACIFGFHTWKEMLGGWRCLHCPERKAEQFPRYVRDKTTRIKNWPSSPNHRKHASKTDPE